MTDIRVGQRWGRKSMVVRVRRPGVFRVVFESEASGVVYRLSKARFLERYTLIEEPADG